MVSLSINSLLCFRGTYSIVEILWKIIVFQIIICMYIFMPIFDSCLPIILFGGEEGREEEESLTPEKEWIQNKIPFWIGCRLL